jgi:D-arginine dehydrogenase
MHQFEVLVVGGGIAGVSIAYELAADRSVCLLEMEATLAFHTTGRSAATFLESYGGPVIRRLTVSSRSFFEGPPDGFDMPLLISRPLLWLGPVGKGDAIRGLEAEVKPLVPSVHIVEGDEIPELHPMVRPGYAELGMLEPGAMEIDVSALHQGYVRGLRSRGGKVVTSSGVVGLSAVDGRWQATTADGELYEGSVVVDAAGAWGDEVASLAGVTPVGLHPLRRTLFMIGAPDGVDIGHLPLTGDIDVTWYMKPEGPQFLCSPADETPSPPCDAKVDEVDVARALERIRAATVLEARHVRSSWAGLRTFTADRTPIACEDPDHPGFFWLVGQGGYGIQTAPALARCAASFVRGEGVPADVAERGLTSSDLHRDRLAGATQLAAH